MSSDGKYESELDRISRESNTVVREKVGREMEFSNRATVDLKAETSSLQIIGCQGQQNTAAREVHVAVQNQKRPLSVGSEHMVGMGQGACLKTDLTGVLKQYERSRIRFGTSHSASLGHIGSISESNPRCFLGAMKENSCSEGTESASKEVSRERKIPTGAVRRKMESSDIDMVDLEEDRSSVGIHGCQGLHNIKVGGAQLTLKNLQKPLSMGSEHRPGKDHQDSSKTVVEGLQHCAGPIDGLDSCRSGSTDTSSESSAKLYREAMSSGVKFELVSEGATMELNTQVKGKVGREKEFSNRDMADLERDRSSAEVHQLQDHHLVSGDMETVVQNLGEPPLERSVPGLMSEQARDSQSLAYGKTHDQHVIVSNTTIRPNHFRQKGLYQSSSKLQSAPVSVFRPPRRLQMAGDRRNLSRPALKLELESSERPILSQSEPNAPLENSHMNLGSLEAYHGQGHMFSADSDSKSISCTHGQLPKEKGVVQNPVGSPTRQDESFVATGPDFQILGSFPSEQGQRMRKRRKLLSSNESASGSACSTGSFRLRGPVSSHRARHAHCDVATERPIQVDEFESPRRIAVRINIEDDEDSERTRQIEQDENLAMVLQEEYDLEAVSGGPTFQDDAQVARMLQEEEYARRTQHMAQLSPLNFPFPRRSTSAMQAVRREMQRVLPSVSSHAGRSSSRMRILRGLHNRGNRYQMRGNLLGAAGVNSDGSLFHFPEEVDVDTRLNILAAIESMLQESQTSQESPLEHLDRDFNENDYEMLLALDDTNHERNGASHDMIERLPVSIIQPTDVYEEICSICLERPIIGDKVRRLPCMHGFHQQCIDAWLNRQANCPICKGSI